ncbi:hypothetical protein [Capnocytophaga gingivalis]|jgi:hypothetical protein|uniref:hypothetical protein n=1 Tax=Capnocytophaga gingivalis TaxID=1017 RepID=UPI0023520FA4|nr:hypothetical protein [Capnocytophaga gingivalis]MEB3014496.1 hypothetical protein [Capnocytophaga gingivalis]
MKKATQYILIAIAIEVLLALLTYESVNFLITKNHIGFFSDFNGIFFSIGSGILMCVVLGILIGEFFPFERQPRALQIYLGIIILFFLLFEGVLTGYFVENARYSLFHFDWNNLGILFLIFLIFGGIQTLGVGIWLGMKLKKMKSEG